MKNPHTLIWLQNTIEMQAVLRDMAIEEGHSRAVAVAQDTIDYFSGMVDRGEFVEEGEE